MSNREKKLPEILPVLPLKDAIIFPRMIMPLMIREKSHLNLVDDALQKDKLIVLAMAIDPEKLHDVQADVHRVGTVGQVIKMTKGDEGTLLVIQGLARIAISKIVSKEPYQLAKIKELKEIERPDKEMSAMATNIWKLFKKIVDMSPHLPDELVQLSLNIDQPGPLADLIVSTLNLERNKKQEILECLDVKKRLKRLTVLLNEELELQEMGVKIQDQVKKGIDDSQREYYLREQLNAIQKELVMDKETTSEIVELKEKNGRSS